MLPHKLKDKTNGMCYNSEALSTSEGPSKNIATFALGLRATWSQIPDPLSLLMFPRKWRQQPSRLLLLCLASWISSSLPGSEEMALVPCCRSTAACSIHFRRGNVGSRPGEDRAKSTDWVGREPLIWNYVGGPRKSRVIDLLICCLKPTGDW